MTISLQRWSVGASLVGGAALVAVALGAATAPAARADDLLADLGLTGSANPDDPAVFYFSADPSNVFSPVYTISPTGAEDVISTDASGTVGTQDFTVSYFGIPVDTFTGGVTYAPVSSPLDLFGNPYVEDVSIVNAPAGLIPSDTGFLTEEFGGGYGNVLEEANITSTSPIIGDFLTTPFGPDNVTSFVNELMNFAGSVTGTTSAVDPTSFVDLLSSIGL